jgi:hypothetical protein
VREGCEEDRKYGWTVRPHLLNQVSPEIKVVFFQIHSADVGVGNLETQDGSKAICDMGGREKGGINKIQITAAI